VKVNSASCWFLLHGYITIHGRQNIKFFLCVLITETSLECLSLGALHVSFHYGTPAFSANSSCVIKPSSCSEECLRHFSVPFVCVAVTDNVNRY